MGDRAEGVAETDARAPNSTHRRNARQTLRCTTLVLMTGITSAVP
jgi:hypothetical protein